MRSLAKRYGIDQKTVAKWKKRTSVADLATGPRQPRSTVFTLEQEAIIVATRFCRWITVFMRFSRRSPPVVVFIASLPATHGISRLPDVEGDKPAKKTFKDYPIGYFHIDIAEVQTAEGKLRLFVGIDRTSKLAYAELHQKAGKMVAAQFLRNLIAAVPYTILRC